MNVINKDQAELSVGEKYKAAAWIILRTLNLIWEVEQEGARKRIAS